MSEVSAPAENLVIGAEVSSHTAYDRVYHRPEWPGGASGVTWGIGYDGGQSSAQTITNDWQGRVSANCLNAMVTCAGVTGERAHALLPVVHDLIDVPWDKAMDVFEHRDVPKYVAMCKHALGPNFDLLPPDCKGALFSLVYNRGPAGFSGAGDRYTEMRSIKLHVASKDFSSIPSELRSMARLWPTMRGLQTRREAEAQLFERGLKAPLATKPAPRPYVAPPSAPAAPEDFWSHLVDRGLSYLEKLE